MKERTHEQKKERNNDSKDTRKNTRENERQTERTTGTWKEQRKNEGNTDLLTENKLKKARHTKE